MASYYADDGTTGMKTKVFCNQIIIRSGRGWVLCTKNCVSGKSQRVKLRPVSVVVWIKNKHPVRISKIHQHRN